MKTHLRVARPFLVVLLLFAVGRLVQGSSGVAYEKVHHVFSLVTLTLIAVPFHGAFARRWLGYGAVQALTLGAVMGFATQVVIFVCTIGSFLVGAQTFFNHPIALNMAMLGDSADKISAVVPTLGDALPRRAGGLVFGSLLGALAAGLGWALGALLPADPRKD